MADRIYNVSINDLDLIMKDSVFAVYSGNTPLTTPAGTSIQHSNPRLLQHIIRELTLSGEMDCTGINSINLFRLQTEFIETGRDLFAENYDYLLHNDPFIKLKTGKNQDSEQDSIDFLFDFIEEKKLNLNFMFGGISSIIKSFNDFLLKNEDNQAYKLSEEEDFSAFLLSVYNALPDSKKAAVNALAAAHQSYLVLPLLLVLFEITPAEYVNSLFSLYVPYKSEPESALKERFADLHIKVYLPDWKNPGTSYSELKSQTVAAAEYLYYFDFREDRSSEAEQIIAQGESFNVEFKTTLRRNIHTNKNDNRMEHACLKSVAAFLNSSGGTLLIGVRDDGSVEGIESDSFDNEDKFSLHFWNLVKASLGQDLAPFISTRFEELDEKKVFVVSCSKSTKPVFLTQSGFGEEFYIRTGPSSSQLSISDALKYISVRFQKS